MALQLRTDGPPPYSVASCAAFRSPPTASLILPVTIFGEPITQTLFMTRFPFAFSWKPFDGVAGVALASPVANRVRDGVRRHPAGLASCYREDWPPRPHGLATLRHAACGRVGQISWRSDRECGRSILALAARCCSRTWINTPYFLRLSLKRRYRPRRGPCPYPPLYCRRRAARAARGRSNLSSGATLSCSC
jgi:hypothetical protein